MERRLKQLSHQLRLLEQIGSTPTAVCICYMGLLFLINTLMLKSGKCAWNHSQRIFSSTKTILEAMKPYSLLQYLREVCSIVIM